MISFFVHGEPVAQPRPRPRGSGRGVYNPHTADAWKDAVVLASNGKPRLCGAVVVDLIFSFLRPKSHYAVTHHIKGSAPILHTQKPDVDNLAKSTLDALVKSGLLTDDKIVVRLTVEKRWTELPSHQGCDVMVESQAPF